MRKTQFQYLPPCIKVVNVKAQRMLCSSNDGAMSMMEKELDNNSFDEK